MTETRPVFVEVEGGHVHRGFYREGVLFVDEGCNVDDAAHRHELSADDLLLREPWTLCARKGCFPPDEGVPDA